MERLEDCRWERSSNGGSRVGTWLVLGLLIGTLGACGAAEESAPAVEGFTEANTAGKTVYVVYGAGLFFFSEFGSDGVRTKPAKGVFTLDTAWPDTKTNNYVINDDGSLDFISNNDGTGRTLTVLSNHADYREIKTSPAVGSFEVGRQYFSHADARARVIELGGSACLSTAPVSCSTMDGSGTADMSSCSAEWTCACGTAKLSCKAGADGHDCSCFDGAVEIGNCQLQDACDGGSSDFAQRAATCCGFSLE